MTVVHRLLTAHALERPEAPVFLAASGDEQLTWRALAAHMAQWLRRARERGLVPRSRIGLLTADPLTFAAAYLGCLGAGLAAVPIDPRTSPERLGGVAGMLKLDVLAGDDVDAITQARRCDAWRLDRSGPVVVAPAAGGAPRQAPPARRPAVLLLTSGTTGAPRGIGLSEHQLLHAARRIVRHHGLGPADRGYNTLPMFHVNAQVVGVLGTLVSGGSLVLEGRFQRGSYWPRVASSEATWVNAVPAILAALANEAPPDDGVVHRLRFARTASAPLPTSTLTAFERHTGVHVLETYGMTEAASQITANPIEEVRRRPGSVGLPVGVGLRVVTRAGEPAAPGEIGTVQLSGRAVATHSIDLRSDGPEQARPSRDAAGWLVTGDLGWRDEQGYLWLTGRADDVINRGGEKVYPQEVEDVLLSHPAVVAAAVVPAPHPTLWQVPAAFVTAGDIDVERLTEELRAVCTARLVPFKRPVDIHVAPALPVGPTGKVLRRELRAMLAEAPLRADQPPHPRSLPEGDVWTRT